MKLGEDFNPGTQEEPNDQADGGRRGDEVRVPAYTKTAWKTIQAS